MNVKLYIITFFLFITGVLNAQINSKAFRKKTLFVANSQISIDTLSITPNSVKITYLDGSKLDTSKYIVLPLSAKLFPKQAINDSLTIQYRILQYNFIKKHNLLDSTIIIADSSVNYKPIRFSALPENRDLFGTKGLNKSGSISRGAFFGNNQNLSLNSNLNLQLSGEISPGINITASVTDDNIPIQPQGNTQQLQDFDQVFIQVFSAPWKLKAGDFWLKKPKGYFLSYNKRAQGATYQYFTKDNRFKTQISTAISKGKFARNVIQGIEGNQGPYKLVGEENELFVIILSGTERVYIDGKQLTRGQEQDYTIDYNTAELSFTTNHLITKDKRIVVEFQYSDKNYARILLQNSNEFKKDNTTYYFNYYSEQDSKNQPLQQDLQTQDLAILNSVGDNLNSAISQSIDSVEFSTEIVLYKKIDSLGYTYYQYSTSEDSAFYQLSFSNVGQGNGDYIQNDFSAFGRIYSWVFPDTVNGVLIHNGDYNPVRLLATPKKRQMITGGFERKLDKTSLLKFEMAMSNTDLNTFSQIDNADNLGFSGKLSARKTKNLSSFWNLKYKLDAESISRTFSRIERFRAVEFERNWNVQRQDLYGNQYSAIAGIELLGNNKEKLAYNFNTYHIDTSYSGYKNEVNIFIDKKVHIDFKGSYLYSDGSKNTSFLRHKSDVYYKTKFFKIGFKDINEENVFSISDSILINSYRFYDWQIYCEQADSIKNKFRIYYQERYDWISNNISLKKAVKAKSIGIKQSIVTNVNHKLNISAAIRSLDTTSPSLVNIVPENTMTGRVDYKLKVLKGMINSSTYYELGSGLELKKEFIYIEVPIGQGIYTWIDYNNDGVKDLAEFELAQYQDQATYIRVFTPSNEYVKVHSYQLSEIINIKPRYYFKKNVKAVKLLNRFSYQLALRQEKKTSAENISDFISPFTNNISDTLLQSISNSFRNSMFFNRSNPKFGMEYSYRQYASKLLLVSGFDSRQNQNNELKIRWNIKRVITMLINIENSTKYNNSDYAPTRNYSLFIEKYNAKLSYQPNTKFRFSIIGDYSEKQNDLQYGGEKAFISDFGTELRYNKASKGSLTMNMNYIYINYYGEASSSVAFEMLEALQPGNNSTWNISYQRTLANNLQLTFSYNGRKSFETKSIHTGGVQLRAFF